LILRVNSIRLAFQFRIGVVIFLHDDQVGVVEKSRERLSVGKASFEVVHKVVYHEIIAKKEYCPHDALGNQLLFYQ